MKKQCRQPDKSFYKEEGKKRVLSILSEATEIARKFADTTGGFRFGVSRGSIYLETYKIIANTMLSDLTTQMNMLRMPSALMNALNMLGLGGVDPHHPRFVVASVKKPEKVKGKKGGTPTSIIGANGKPLTLEQLEKQSNRKKK